jgi:hypothetical protein
MAIIDLSFPRKTLTFLLLSFFCIASAQVGSNKKDTIEKISPIRRGTENELTKIEIINKSFDDLATKLINQATQKSAIWDTIIPLLIGSALTLLAQFFIEYWKSRKEISQKKYELISRGRAKTYLISQILKDLAMYKVHKQYYARIHSLGGDEENNKKHYEKGQELRVVESKLDENVAEYFQLVTEYISLTNNKDGFQGRFEKIFQFKHPKSTRFTEYETIDDLIVGLEREEDRLNSEYKKLIDDFEAIQVAMK